MMPPRSTYRRGFAAELNLARRLIESIIERDFGTADTMTVTVRDRAREAASWGHGLGGVITRTVTISAFCPVCGERRGTPKLRPFFEDGEPFSLHVWDNPCGHLDSYADVLKESAT